MTKNNSTIKILEDATKLFKERSGQYGKNYERVGKIISILFPDGLDLKTEKDFERYHIFQYLIAKISRYCYNYGKIKSASEVLEDSIFDLTVYAAIMASIDKDIFDQNKNKENE